VIAVVGAGAAGLMAAIHAAEGPEEVLLFETTKDGGRKILISGGGRCNVLPSTSAEQRFVTDSSPNSLKLLLRAWPLGEQRRFFEETLHVPLALEPETGKLFPRSNRARDVRDGLIALARERGVGFRLGARVTGLDRRADGAWSLELGGESVVVRSVVLATGGSSVPATGSDGAGFELVRRLGLTVNPTYPALTPLVADRAPHRMLAGLSLAASLRGTDRSGRETTSQGGFLFTHRGYSGPSVLDVSHVATRARLGGNGAASILVNWTSDNAATWESRLQAGGTTRVAAMVRQSMPSRLADQLLAESGVPLDRELGQLARGERRELVTKLTAYTLEWSSDEGYRKAEVTGGGVDLSEIDSRTLESKRQPGLYLCGEILDAFGPIGGHNFQWAWATGRAAGLAAANPVR
jgi:predicted Rossmann fold flavoprotein